MRNKLLPFGCLVDDTKCVLAAVKRLALVPPVLFFNLPLRRLFFGMGGFELSATGFAHGMDETGNASDYSQFSFRHETSLAPNACEHETAPVPDFSSNGSHADSPAQNGFHSQTTLTLR
jgi:hypothetical protein